MNKIYNVLHLHTDYSNGVTSIDSVTKYESYIKKAKEENMTAIAFTEHGSVFDWYKKKECCEENGLKYIHAIEMYITKTLKEKIRDNYHCCMYALNYDGFLELNKLASKSFNRKNGSYYYSPRITVEDLLNTSDNIAITSACLGGFFGKANKELEDVILNFMKENKHRCFLEIQHHNVNSQIRLNKKLYDMHLQTGIRLICGTDTHALNDTHAKGRTILQKAKNIHFDNEDGWDITFKTYDELLTLFNNQDIMPVAKIEECLNNTLVLSNMVEDFSIDKSYKYPKLYDDGLSVLKQKINAGILIRGINKYENYKSEYIPRIKYELDTYIHNGAVDFLLLDEDIKSNMREKGIFPGYSRGSVSGSLIAYIIGMTDVDSIKHNMSFERFMNIERVSLADVDTDWQPNQREVVKDYIYEKEGLYCADIVTFNTVALKGSIRDVCRALYMSETSEGLKKQADNEVKNYGKISSFTSKKIEETTKGYLKIADYICSNVEDDEEKMRKEYPEVFEYVDIINGTIVSIGTHPCGTIVSPIPLEEVVGLCSISTCERPVSMLSMKCIDAQNFTKLDILGLDNIQLINETCKLANIERLIPENVPDDENVWKSIADNNLLIFQWESDSAGAFLKTLLSENTINKIKEKNPNFKYLDLVTMGNGAIRPAGASYRDALARGEFRDNGHEALNNLLASTNGYLVYQEQIIEFLNKFCGYTMGEADIVRRGFAKKTGTEQFIPNIKSGFVKTMKEKYNVESDEAENLIVNFLQIINDASEYLFSLNHSEPYTYIGYICAYLRYYYPLEFLTVALNINMDDHEKTAKIVEYAKNIGINLNNAKFRYSKDGCFFNKETNSIYKGIASIKFLNAKVAEELYSLKDKQFNSFTELLHYIKQNCSANFKQLRILISLNYFSEFGKNKKLLDIIKLYETKLKNKNLKEETKQKRLLEIIEVEKTMENKSLNIKEQIEAEKEYLGYEVTTIAKLPKNVYIVTEIDTKYTPKLRMYNLKEGTVETWKCKKTDMRKEPFGQYSVLKVLEISKNNKRKKINNEWIKTDEIETSLTKWQVIM